MKYISYDMDELFWNITLNKIINTKNYPNLSKTPVDTIKFVLINIKRLIEKDLEIFL